MNAAAPVFSLTPWSIAYADVLRAVADGATDAPAVCAVTHRPSKNMTRDLGRLVEEGLLSRPSGQAYAVTAAAVRALQAMDFAASDVELDGATVLLPWDQIFPDTVLNPRKTCDRERLEALAADLLASRPRPGRPKQNLVVRRTAQGGYRIIDGWRRWQALGLLIEEGHFEPTLPVPCLIEDVDDREHRIQALKSAALAEDHKPLEQAAAIAEWMADEPTLTTAGVAQELRISQRTVQMRLSLLTAPPIIKAELEAGKIGTKEALERMREAAGTTRPPAADKPAGGLPPRQVLIMVEVALKHARGGPQVFPNYADATRAILDDKDFGDLAKASLLMTITRGQEVGVRPTNEGRAWLMRNAVSPSQARAACGLSAEICDLLDEQGTFATTWLDDHVSAAAGQDLAAEPAPEAPEPEASEADTDEQPAPVQTQTQPPRTASHAVMDARVIADMHEAVVERLNHWRDRVSRGAEVHWSECAVPALVDDLFAALRGGHAVEAATLIAVLRLRAGAMGACDAIREGAAEHNLLTDEA